MTLIKATNLKLKVVEKSSKIKNYKPTKKLKFWPQNSKKIKKKLVYLIKIIMITII